MAEQESERLRPHPSLRFAAPQHQFDLEEVATRLKQELDAGESGHRQETLYKRGGVTVSLFIFEHLSHIPPHRASGVVTIHVLKGHLQVIAEDQTHNLYSGNLLVMAPCVQHDVVARQETWMLLTVNLDGTPNS